MADSNETNMKTDPGNEEPQHPPAGSSTPAHWEITPVPVYLAVFATLMVLTALTIIVAFFDLGMFGTPVAIGIAVIKATCVILWFMHVKYSSKLTWVVVIGSAFFLLILFGITLSDYLTRFWILT
ncbi:MAG: cytochrome C oxidase subunit IV family protein [Thermoanaerobaculia bacterium]|nr:cytochrome C oxidase subunit IV family protein [Thermoanaerobaculia bacterium]